MVLIHSLANELSKVPKHLRHLIPPPGVVMDLRLSDIDEAGWQITSDELARMKVGGTR
jgi:hypothetical protein